MTKMRDVAELAGVSVMTVSNVLNGKPKVNAETRARVLQAVEQSGYRMNINARRLRQGTSNTVAMIIPRFDHTYFGELAAKFSEKLSGSGLHLVVEQSNALAEHELEAISLFPLNSYAGVVLSSVGLTGAQIDKLDLGIPVVLLGEQDMPERFDHVMMGNTAGAELAVAHMLRTGARRVIMLGAADPTADKGMGGMRTRGWQRAYAAAGLDCDPGLAVHVPQYEPDVAYDTMRRVIESGMEFDGVFAITDSVGFGALAAVLDSGLRVPEDVQLVGFDNLEMSEIVRPSLSSIDPDRELMVEHIFRLLQERIAHGYNNIPPEHIVSTVNLVERASTR